MGGAHWWDIPKELAQYTNCIAKNVKILTEGTNSFRVGGLIGYIEKKKVHQMQQLH